MAKIEIEDTELAELRKSVNDLTKKAALADALGSKVTDLERQAAGVADMQAQLAAFQAEKLEAAWTGAKIADPKIRRVFQLEFEEQAAAPTGEKDLGKWLAGVQALPADKRPAHLSPFLSTSAGGQGAGGQGGPRTGVIPDTGRGAGGGPTADVGGITPEAVLKADPQQFAAIYQQLMTASPAQYGTSLPSGIKPPATPN